MDIFQRYLSACLLHLGVLDVKIVVNYASTVMESKTGVWLEAGLLLLTFFVIVPLIAAAMYWTAFAAASAASLFLMVYAQRMHADVRTSQYLLQIACFGLGALLFGVAGGCMVGIFTYRRNPVTQDPSE